MSSPSFGAFSLRFNLVPPVPLVGVAPKLVGPLATVNETSKDYHRLIIEVNTTVVISSQWLVFGRPNRYDGVPFHGA